MSNFENGRPTIGEFPDSSESFGKILDEIVEDRIEIGTSSIDSELFELSLKYSDESVDKNNQIDKKTIDADNFVEIISSPNVNGKNHPSSKKNCIGQNDSNLVVTPEYNGQNEINFGGYLSSQTTQDSLCTECRYGNRQNSSFSLNNNNNTQYQAESSCFQTSGMNQNNETIVRDDLQYLGNRFLRKRSLSVTTEKIESEIPMTQMINDLKKFKSEDSILTVRIAGNPTKITREISTQEFNDISGETEPFTTDCSDSCPIENTAEKIRETPIDENIETIKIDDDFSFMNEINASQGRNLDSNFSNSTFSESTIEEIYCINENDEIRNSKNLEMIKEMEETCSLERNNSTFSQSTIEEIYLIDAVNDIETPLCEIVEENSKMNKINDEIIEEKEIEFDPKLSDEINMKENSNPVRFGSEKNLERKKADDGFHFQSLKETELKRTEKEGQIIGENVVSVHQIDVRRKDGFDSAKDLEFRNKGISKLLDESILEITMESETEQIIKEDKIYDGRKINSVNVVGDLKTNFKNSKNGFSKDKKEKEKRNEAVDSMILNVNNNPVGDSIPLKNDNTDENIKKKTIIIAADYLNSQFLTETELEKIDKQLNEMETKTGDKDPQDANIHSKIDDNIGDDLSLEFLSDSQLEKIEEEAYMQAKETGAINFSNIEKVKSIVNKKDVFYKPERPNIITGTSTNDLVLPNWVTNPAPEPNYEKLRCAVQMRREYIKKMLQEILRLSSIVSEVKGIVYAQHRQSIEKRNSEIEDRGMFQLKETDTNNRSVKSEAFCNSEDNNNRRSSVVTRDFEDGDIFYVPESNRSKNNALSDVLSASGNITGMKHNNSKEKENFYTPELNASKYDASAIFNRPRDLELNKSRVSNNETRSNASSIFGELKREFDENRTRESDVSSVWYNSRESEGGMRGGKTNGNGILKNTDKLKSVMKGGNEYRLPKIGSNVTAVIDKNKAKNKVVEPVKNNNDTIFYFPDKLSSSKSSNYTVLPQVKSNQTFQSVNYGKGISSSYAKRDEQRPLNFGNKLASNAIGNDDGIFYNGNR